MDVNLTIGLPVVGILFGVNTIINFLRLKDGRSGNGLKDKILGDLKDGQKDFTTCFKSIGESGVKQEVLLESILQQLQGLNNRL